MKEHVQQNSITARDICCIAINLFHAEAIVGQLIADEFASDTISLLFAQRDEKTFVNEMNKPSPVTATGSVLPGGLGDLGTLAAVMILGHGRVVGAGPMVATLSNSFSNASIGLAGKLVAAGIAEFPAEYYESNIKAGNVFLSVQSADAQGSERAKEIFSRFEAEHISTSAAPVCA